MRRDTQFVIREVCFYCNGSRYRKFDGEDCRECKQTGYLESTVTLQEILESVGDYIRQERP